MFDDDGARWPGHEDDEYRRFMVYTTGLGEFNFDLNFTTSSYRLDDMESSLASQPRKKMFLIYRESAELVSLGCCKFFSDEYDNKPRFY
ncbi:hypothetical protein AAHA92_17614 [Salvia divinorum]|uniref:Uncharacterized protein n=1 Tax=Salvia divinorum TaxID=28513 RepID=A0ABD1GZD3_SALDI